MAVFDPTYGELLTAKEVSTATGLTMNQLRNWRVASRMDKAPFGFVQIGLAPYYRKASVQLWLDRNLGANVKYQPAGTDKEVPLGIASEGDFEKRKALGEIAQITSETVFGVYYSPVRSRDPENFNKVFAERMNYYRAKHHGVDAESLERVVSPQRHSQPDWFIGAVPTIRELYAQQQGYDLTEEEILSAPLGQIPPLKEKNI